MTIPGNDETYLDILKKSAYPRERDVKVKTKKESATVRKKGKKVSVQIDTTDEKNVSYSDDVTFPSEIANDVQPISIVKNDEPANKYLNKKAIKPTKIKIHISQDDKTPDPDNTVH